MAKTISESVGFACKNRPADVETIQRLLNNVPVGQGGPNPKLGVDGAYGSRTENALQAFQLAQFGWKGADRKVFPGGETLAALNRFDTTGPAPPPPVPGTVPGIPPFPPAPVDVSQSFRIRAVRCGVERLPDRHGGRTVGLSCEDGYHFELHDTTNARVTVFSLVNNDSPDGIMEAQFTGRPEVQYREFTHFRTRDAYRLEDFRGVPARFVVFLKPLNDEVNVPWYGRLRLQMPGGEVLIVSMNQFQDEYQPGPVVSEEMTDCTFMLNFLVGDWKPRG